MPNSLLKSEKTPSIKILGAYGGKAVNMQLTSLQVSKDTVIDAGNLIGGLGNGIKNINHIFVSHSHLDHILDIGLLIDATYEIRKTPLKIYARKGTLENIKKHILNWEIWPDFTQINLLNSKTPSIELIEIQIDQTIEINGCKIKAVSNNHTNSSNGYVIEKENKALLFTSDTYCCKEVWDEINSNTKISTVIIDVSFPSRLSQLAYDSKHLTPELLKQELGNLKRDNITLHINHIKPTYKNEILQEVMQNKLLLNDGLVLEAQDIISF